MVKKIIKCKDECPIHIFSLKPLNHWAYLTKNVCVKFCCAQKYKKHTFPKFNKDKLYYTPCFTLSIDQEEIMQNEEQYLMQHQQKVLLNLTYKKQIMVAKPRTKNNYCSVCELQFNDYLKHISSSKHQCNINDNKFNQFIKQLCKKQSNQIYQQQLLLQKVTSVTTLHEDPKYSESLPESNHQNTNQNNKKHKTKLPIIINSMILSNK